MTIRSSESVASRLPGPALEQRYIHPIVGRVQESVSWCGVNSRDASRGFILLFHHIPQENILQSSAGIDGTVRIHTNWSVGCSAHICITHMCSFLLISVPCTFVKYKTYSQRMRFRSRNIHAAILGKLSNTYPHSQALSLSKKRYLLVIGVNLCTLHNKSGVFAVLMSWRDKLQLSILYNFAKKNTACLLN